MRILPLAFLAAAHSAAAELAGAPTRHRSRRRGPVRKDAVDTSTRGLLRKRALQPEPDAPVTLPAVNGIDGMEAYDPTAEDGAIVVTTMCAFCPLGVPDPEAPCPRGIPGCAPSCGAAAAFASALVGDDENCAAVKLAEEFCCGSAEVPALPPAPAMIATEEEEGVETEFAFAGPVWTALQYRDPATDALIDVLPIEGYGSITLRFDDGGRLSGNGGCNNYFGGYTDPTEETLTIDGPVTTTLMLCESDAINDQERKYLGLLAGTLGWAASAARLELSDVEGNVVLKYGALPEGAGSPATLPAGVPDATTEPNAHMTLPAMDGIDGMEAYDPFLGLSEGSMPSTVAPPADSTEADTTEAACKRIVEIAASEDNFSTLVAAVTAANLTDALSGEGPLTVFAPTNEAFAALPEGALDALLADPYALAEVLKYHVVPTEALSSGLALSGDNAQKCGASGAWRRCRFEALNGDLVAVLVSENGARVNEANVIAPSPVACNGVIHMIDKVLVPPAGLFPPKPPTQSPSGSPTKSPTGPPVEPVLPTTPSPTTAPTSNPTQSPAAPPTKSPTGPPTQSPSGTPTTTEDHAELIVFPWVDEGASEDGGWGGAAVYEMSVKAKSSKHATFMSLGTKAAKPAMSLPTTKPKAQKEPGFGKSGKRSKKMGSKSAGFSLSLPGDVPSSKGGKRAKSSSKASKSKGQTAVLSRPEGLPGLPPNGAGPKPKSGKSVFGPKPKGDKLASPKSAKSAPTAFGEATLDAKAKKVSSNGKAGKKDADAHSMALVDEGWQGSRRRLQEACAFCPSGIPIPFFPLPPDLPLPDGVGATCETAAAYAATLLAGDADCAIVREAMALCCPNDVAVAETNSTAAPETTVVPASDSTTVAAQTTAAASSVPSSMPSGAPSSAPSEMPSGAPTQLPVAETASTGATAAASSSTLAASTTEPTTLSTQAGDVCSFCPGGIPIPNFPLPTDEPGATCETATTYAATLLASEANCTTVKLAEPLCCPDSVVLTSTAMPQTTTAACQSIADIIESSGDVDFSILMAAVAAANLTETLSGEGPLTVFAPTDEAFAALPEGALDLLLADPDALAEVLEYHVVSGNVLSSDLESGNVETLSGESVAVLVLDEGVLINDALVTSADILACNGVIHVVNKVLLPPSEDSTSSSTAVPETTASSTTVAAPETTVPFTTSTTTTQTTTTTTKRETPFPTAAPDDTATTEAATDAPEPTTTVTEPTDLMTEPTEPEDEEASRDTESSEDSPASGVSGKAAKRSKKRSKAAGSKASSTASTTAPKPASKSGKNGGGDMSIGSKSSKLTKQSGHSSSGKSHKEQTAIFFRPGSLYGTASGKTGKEGLSMPSSKSSKTLERPAPKGGSKSGKSAAGPKPKSDKVDSSKSAKGAYEAFGEATLDAKAKKVSSGKAGKKEAGAAQSMPTMDDGWQGSGGEEKLPPRR